MHVPANHVTVLAAHAETNYVPNSYRSIQMYFPAALSEKGGKKEEQK